MRSGGSVRKTSRAAEGTLPRERKHKTARYIPQCILATRGIITL